MNWACVTVTTSNEASEAVANVLLEMDAIGVELKYVDDSTTSLIAYYPLDDRIDSRIRQLRSFLNQLPEWGLEPNPARIDLKRIQSEKWAEAWKSKIVPQRIGKRLLIAPTWHNIDLDDTTILIRLDPGMAFGTGYHPTTRLSLELLEQTIQPGQSVVDIGTGSGILAIASIKLGANHVDAIELDTSAIPVAKTNIEINGITEKIVLQQGDGLKDVKKRYDLIVGNILTKAILPIIPYCPSRLHPEGQVIFSGILETELDMVKDELAENGLQCLQVLREAEDDIVWTAVKAKYTKTQTYSGTSFANP